MSLPVPPLNLSQALAENLVDARTSPTDEAAGDLTAQEPLQGSPAGVAREGTAEANREAYQENQRLLAAQILARVCFCTVCIPGVSLSLLLFTLFVYHKGYGVYVYHAHKPCDEPLSLWLAVVLTVLPLRVALALLYRCHRNGQTEESNSCVTKTIYVILKVWHLVGNPALIGTGFYWFRNSKTCEKTNPELHGFVRLFLIYQVLMWAGGIMIFFGATSFILWARRNNLFDTGPGPHAAAKPGVIDKIETVEYDPSLFSQTPGDEKEPPECCVCQLPYDENAVIKRTPCGHYFHAECLGNWLGNYAKSCPLCRNNLEDAVEGEDGMV